MEELLQKFFNGECYNAYEYFGAHPYQTGYIFRVFAPNALKIEVIGDFNNWNGSFHLMKKIDKRGIFELYIKNLKQNNLYKYHILTQNKMWISKADPYAFFSELRPNTASILCDLSYEFLDTQWMKTRTKCFNQPLNIYEIHLGSFYKKNQSFLTYEKLASKLIPYVKKHHFTHIEIMPLMEHPFDGSWGYQVSQYYSVTSRYGHPLGLKKFIEACHLNQIGVIMDFVPLHFVKDDSALGEFDGGHVYESNDISKRYSQWDTYLFDFSKPSVMSYLLSCAYFYFKEYHIDGMRFDAISNMIFKDGNKNNGEQLPNINWMKKTNDILSKSFFNIMLIAEDSSDYANVTKPTFENGLGFDYKWDLGWMNDTLKYFKEDPLFRGNHLNLINFSMYYFYNERFLLPLSHDEVVHMKGSMINKMWGSYQQKFQQLRILYAYMFTHPGKKLNFMGNELALFDEWNENKGLNFDILKYPIHDAFNQYFKSLTKLYVKEPAFYIDEYNPSLFYWIDCNNQNNVFIYARNYKRTTFLIILNFSSIQYPHYLINVKQKSGKYYEIINSDDFKYNGYGYINSLDINIQNHQIDVKIASFSALILKFKN